MKPFDPYRLYAAVALDRSTFAISFSNKDYEDMYAYVLVYEGQFEQPWTRFDMPRNITGLTAQRGADGRPLVHALSDEGEVYTLPVDDQKPSKLKIGGAGVYSEDATDLGYVNAMTQIDDTFLVTGHHSQLYRIAGGRWDWFHKDKLPRAPETYDYLNFGCLTGTTDTDLYMSVSYYPKNERRKLTEEENARHQELVKQGRYEEALDLEEAAKKAPTRVIEGRLYHWDGQDWQVVATPRSGKFYPEPATLADIFIETKDKVWAVGGNGVILVGNADRGFQDVSFKGDSEKLISITKFKDRMVIASDYALHWFDGHLLSPLKPVLDPTVNKNIPTPIKVQTVDDMLYYFDAKHGVHSFDGERWTEIDIPSELLQRDFKGLSSKP